MERSDPATESVSSKKAQREAEWTAWIQAASAGDEVLFARFYDETSGFVYSLAFRMLGNAEEAEEVTLDVYKQVWRTAKTFDRSRGSVTAWLATLARSRALDRIRSRGSRFQKHETVELASDIASPGEDPEQSSWIAQRRRFVLDALQKLPVEQRTVLELAYLSGLSHTELAAHVGEPLGTIKTRIRLGMAKMRELLVAAEGGLA